MYFGSYGVVIENGSILLLEKQSGPYQGLLDLPGGKIEVGETSLQALHREFLEEAAQQVVSCSYLTNMVMDFPGSFHHSGDLYKVHEMRFISGLEPEEECGWYQLKDLRWETMTPFARYAVALEQIEVSEKPPLGFHPDLVVAGVLVFFEGRFLLLKRHQFVSQGGTWGIPAGKLEEGESFACCAARELCEETGVSLVPEQLEPFMSLYIRYPLSQFEMHVYTVDVSERPKIVLELEKNSEFRWVSAQEAMKLAIVPGGMQIMQRVLNRVKGNL